jgi:hypothetical protein
MQAAIPSEIKMRLVVPDLVRNNPSPSTELLTMATHLLLTPIPNIGRYEHGASDARKSRLGNVFGPGRQKIHHANADDRLQCGNSRNSFKVNLSFRLIP